MRDRHIVPGTSPRRQIRQDFAMPLRHNPIHRSDKNFLIYLLNCKVLQSLSISCVYQMCTSTYTWFIVVRSQRSVTSVQFVKHTL